MNSIDFTHKDFRRTPGKASGCSCCGFTALGLLALPLLAVVMLFWIF